MIKTLTAPLVFIVHFSLQMSNLAFWAIIIISLGLVKFLLPFQWLQSLLSPLMNTFMLAFGQVSLGLIKLFNPVKFEYNIHGNMNPKHWYLLIANHRSYLDIIVLIEFSAKRIPAPKFFLKKELIWLPFVGLGAWALDMPFMQRYSRTYIEKNPHKKGADIATTKRYCEKFKNAPTTVINFVEGTRYTRKKHTLKNSPYQHLLPPKAGGIAFTLATMGGMFTNLLDISLLYPDNQQQPMMDMLCGRLKRVVIDVNVLEIPEQTIGDYYADKQFKHNFQLWLNQLWDKKNERISSLLERE
jgi:1-acyl-sn-glycerol-3-phosphate acyltransferase